MVLRVRWTGRLHAAIRLRRSAKQQVKLVEMVDKRVHVRSKLGHQEGHALRHETGNEMHIAAQSIELRDYHWASLLSGFGQGGPELGSPIHMLFQTSK
jgi:hypothetical protein